MRPIGLGCAVLVVVAAACGGSETAPTTTTTITVVTTTTTVATTTTTTIAPTTTVSLPPPIRIDPLAFDDDSAWDQWAGSSDDPLELAATGFTHAHAWGFATGEFRYGFDAPAGDHAIVVTARLSAELGGGFGAPAEDTSDVTLFYDGEPVGTHTVIADDGSGAEYAWEVPEVTEGRHLLAFAVLGDAANAHGLCVYGTAVVEGSSDAAIVLTFTR